MEESLRAADGQATKGDGAGQDVGSALGQVAGPSAANQQVNVDSQRARDAPVGDPSAPSGQDAACRRRSRRDEETRLQQLVSKRAALESDRGGADSTTELSQQIEGSDEGVSIAADSGV